MLMSDIIKTLDKDKTNNGLQNKAIVLLIYETGMKICDVCNIKFSDIHSNEENISVVFGGCRKREIVSSIKEETYNFIVDYFKSVHKREPYNNDYLFYTIHKQWGILEEPIKKGTVWLHLKKSIGLSTRDIERLRVKKTIIKNRDKSGYVYFMSNGSVDGAKYVVIGETKDFEKRLIDYRRHSGPAIDVIEVKKVDNRKQVEKWWHNYFNDKRIHDAWFLLDENDIFFIKNEC